ncbi:hypothetical protein [Lentzea sp.]|uniref:hypothetical protein n=1 Tax=Lentzea sp. TaxID=56099 RepID=UPI002ED013D2
MDEVRCAPARRSVAKGPRGPGVSTGYVSRLAVPAGRWDHGGLLLAAVELRTSWSPGPAVDALE